MLIGVDASRATIDRRTGTEHYSARLIEALLALDSAHFFRLYFSQRPEPCQIPYARDRAQIELRTIRFPRVWTHLRLGTEVALHPPDVLFVPSHVLPYWTRVPSVATVHDLGFLNFPETHPPRQRWYLDWSTRHNARTGRVVIADSRVTKADLVAHYQIDPVKIVVAHPGIDDALVPVTDPQALEAAKHRYHIRSAYFVHIGTLHPRKNLTRLIQAFSRLATETDVQLVLAGKAGWLYDDLLQLVRRLGLQERVVFPGYTADTDKAALLSGAIGCIFPSLYEGFGFPALEAQACDTPLICANTSSLPEVAGDGALYIDPLDVDGIANAMIRLLADAQLRVDLISRGRTNRRRFSWQACAETVMTALETAPTARK